MERLELRMYGLVPYNISPIQQGIQFGHAVVEYELKLGATYDYQEWAHNWKTFIILNGGTTNTHFSVDDGLPFGSMNRHLLSLQEMGINFATFHEPDLGDQLTAIVFIVDERIFNKTKYPDPQPFASQDEQNMFMESIGGEVNYKLRGFLKQFRLA
jgi:hypothetical protein